MNGRHLLTETIVARELAYILAELHGMDVVDLHNLVGCAFETRIDDDSIKIRVRWKDGDAIRLAHDDVGRLELALSLDDFSTRILHPLALKLKPVPPKDEYGWPGDLISIPVHDYGVSP